MIGPIFFPGAARINEERYRTLILEPFIRQLTEDEIEFSFFQQDGAKAHWARGTHRFLEDIFADRVISEGMWPPRSPDLTPHDFWLWGHLKARIYKNNPRTVDEVRANITIEINNITPADLQKVFGSIVKRARKCQEVNGLRFEHLL